MYWQLIIERAKNAKLQAKVNNLQALLRAAKKRTKYLAKQCGEMYCSELCAGNHKTYCSPRYWLAEAVKEVRKEQRKREIHGRKKKVST